MSEVDELVSVDTSPSEKEEHDFVHLLCPKCYSYFSQESLDIGDPYIGACGVETRVPKFFDDPHAFPPETCPFCLELARTGGPCWQGHMSPPLGDL